MSSPPLPSPTWGELSQVDGCDMDHDSELMASHAGEPSIEWQNQHNGAGMPAEDRGPRPGEVAGGPPSVPGPRLVG